MKKKPPHRNKGVKTIIMLNLNKADTKSFR